MFDATEELYQMFNEFFGDHTLVGDQRSAWR
jgi:hypothetical protein